MSTEIRRLLDVREEMLTFLRDTDRRDQRHIITAHWLSKLSVLASPVGQEEPPIQGLLSLVEDCAGRRTPTSRCSGRRFSV